MAINYSVLVKLEYEIEEFEKIRSFVSGLTSVFRFAAISASDFSKPRADQPLKIVNTSCLISIVMNGVMDGLIIGSNRSGQGFRRNSIWSGMSHTVCGSEFGPEGSSPDQNPYDRPLGFSIQLGGS